MNMKQTEQHICTVHKNHRTFRTFLMARPKCLMRDFTNLDRIYKAHRTNVWWTTEVFRQHCICIADAGVDMNATIHISTNNYLLMQSQWVFCYDSNFFHPIAFLWGQGLGCFFVVSSKIDWCSMLLTAMVYSILFNDQSCQSSTQQYYKNRVYLPSKSSELWEPYDNRCGTSTYLRPW